MPKLLHFSVLLTFIFLAGCNNDLDYGDNDVAAVVKGEEITVRELRFLYPDDEILEHLDEDIKIKLVKQEVKEMNLDVSGGMEKEDIQDIAKLPPKDSNNETESSTREFAASQANKLEMQPDNYYQEYVERTNKRSAYVVTYAQEMLGDIEDSENEADYIKEVDKLLNELVQENEDNIEVLIE